MEGCECDASYVCSPCQQVFDLQARDQRTEQKVDALTERVDQLEHQVERLIKRLGEVKP